MFRAFFYYNVCYVWTYVWFALGVRGHVEGTGPTLQSYDQGIFEIGLYNISNRLQNRNKYAIVLLNIFQMGFQAVLFPQYSKIRVLQIIIECKFLKWLLKRYI